MGEGKERSSSREEPREAAIPLVEQSPHLHPAWLCGYVPASRCLMNVLNISNTPPPWPGAVLWSCTKSVRGEGYSLKILRLRNESWKRLWNALSAQGSAHQRLFLSQDMHMPLFPPSFWMVSLVYFHWWKIMRSMVGMEFCPPICSSSLWSCNNVGLQPLSLRKGQPFLPSFLRCNKGTCLGQEFHKLCELDILLFNHCCWPEHLPCD